MFIPNIYFALSKHFFSKVFKEKASLPSTHSFADFKGILKCMYTSLTLNNIDVGHNIFLYYYLIFIM